MSSTAVALYRVPLASLLRYVNPFVTPPWECGPFTIDDVKRAIVKEDLQPLPTPSWHARDEHIARVAYLAVEGWDNRFSPVLDVDAFWPIDDGNHRVCAAVVRGDEYIEMIIVGSLKNTEELLGISLEY